MNTTEIIQTIDAEIARLKKARALLDSHATASKHGRLVNSKPETTTKRAGRRKMSAEGRARIAAAQRARWAKTKRG
jgi:hypothetical protein